MHKHPTASNLILFRKWILCSGSDQLNTGWLLNFLNFFSRMAIQSLKDIRFTYGFLFLETVVIILVCKQSAGKELIWKPVLIDLQPILLWCAWLAMVFPWSGTECQGRSLVTNKFTLWIHPQAEFTESILTCRTIVKIHETLNAFCSLQFFKHNSPAIIRQPSFYCKVTRQHFVSPEQFAASHS